MADALETVSLKELLNTNGEVFRAIDRLIHESARSYAARREGGSSESMNGALDYTALEVCKIILKAADERA